MLSHLSPSKFDKLIANFQSSEKWNFKCKQPTIILFRSSEHLYEKGFRDLYDTLNEKYPSIETFEVINSEDPEIGAAYGIKEIPSTLFIAPTGKYAIGSGFLTPEQIDDYIRNIFSL